MAVSFSLSRIHSRSMRLEAGHNCRSRLFESLDPREVLALAWAVSVGRHSSRPNSSRLLAFEYALYVPMTLHD